MEFILGIQVPFNTEKSIYVIHHIYREGRPHMIIPINAKSICQNITHFHDKNTQKGTSYRRDLPQLDKEC